MKINGRIMWFLLAFYQYKSNFLKISFDVICSFAGITET
jgi:hypothetical protein